MAAPAVTNQTTAKQPVRETEAPPETIPAARGVFDRFKERVSSAWKVSVEHIRSACETVKKFVLRIIEAVRAFFEPKFDAAKQSLRDFSNKVSLKLGARMYSHQIETLKGKNEDLEVRLKQALLEKDNALQANQTITQEKDEAVAARDALQQQLEAQQAAHEESSQIIKAEHIEEHAAATAEEQKQPSPAAPQSGVLAKMNTWFGTKKG